ncbi:MAG: hypothetical protein ACYTFY_06150 [Planctomycetota bacterium]|jgi:hypothetical protein
MVIGSNFAYDNFKSFARAESTDKGISANALSSLKSGDIIDAEIVEDLGSGRYTAEIKTAEAGENKIKINIRTSSELKAGDIVKMEVKSSGARPVLDIISQTQGSTPAENAVKINVNSRGITEFSVPVTQLPEKIQLEHIQPGEIVSLQTDESGSLTAKLSDGSIFKPEDNIIDKNLLNLLNKPVFKEGIDLNVSSAAVKQKVTVMTSIPVQTPAGEELQNIKVAGEIIIPAGEYRELSAKIIPAGQNINAEISASIPGRLTVTANREEFTLNISEKIKLPVKTDAALLPEKPMLNIEGKIHTNLPGALKTAGLTSDSPAQEALDRIITEAGLSTNIQTRQAAASLLAERAPVTRENIQLVISAASNAVDSENPVITNSILRASAHQVAHNFPLEPALTRGISGILTRGEGLSSEINNTAVLIEQSSAIANESGKSEAIQQISQTLTDASVQLKNISVPLGEYNTPEVLAEFTSTLAGPQLQAVLTSLEGSMASYLSENQELSLFDSIIRILTAEWGSPRTVNTAPALNGAEQEAVSRLTQLINDNALPEKVKEIIAKLKPESRQNILQSLRHSERTALEENPVISRITQAHESVQSIVEKAAAYKAENVLASRNDPVVFMAEVPFRMGEDEGDGKLKFYGRKTTKQKTKSWNNRVVVDLIMSNLGPVLGDMKFSESKLDIKIGLADIDAYDLLANDLEELKTALQEKGFNPAVDLKIIEPEPEAENKPAPPLHLPGSTDNSDSIKHLDLEA